MALEIDRYVKLEVKQRAKLGLTVPHILTLRYTKGSVRWPKTTVM